MDFIPEDLQKYVEEHSGAEPELLAQLSRETHQKVLMPRMLSGHLQGRVLSMSVCKCPFWKAINQVVPFIL